MKAKRSYEKNVGNAIVYAIAEDVLKALVWDEELGKYILDGGFALSIGAEFKELAEKVVFPFDKRKTKAA